MTTAARFLWFDPVALRAMTNRWNTFRVSLVGLAIALGFVAPPARASEAFPVRMVGNRLVARAIVKGPAGEVPTHLLIDLGAADALRLHKNVVEMMGVEQSKQLDLTFGAVTFRGVRAFAVDSLSDAEKMTREHSGELEEVPVTGVLGLGAFGEQAVQLNLPDGEVRFGRADDLPRSEAPGAVETAYEPASHGPIFPGQISDGGSVRVQFSTAQFESLASLAAFDKLRIGRPDAAHVMLGSIDLLRRGAYRPSALRRLPQPHPDLVLGIDLLSRFRVTIDPSRRTLRFEPVTDAVVNLKEQGYFIAARDGDADAIERFCVEDPKSWLAPEAAGRLLELRLNSPTSSQESCLRAMDLYAASLPADRRAQSMLAVADQLMADRESRALAMLRQALDLASQSSGDDLNAAAVHQINARRGMLSLREGNMKDARRLLLSAAFGMPGDALVNLWLGEFYEANRQPARAWSRYVESALTRDAPIEALRSLERLDQDSSFRDSFSTADAELMLEGRLLSFSPPRPREPAESASVRLVELFTNGTSRESVGPQLGFDGLAQFFDGAPVVFVAYHLDASMGNATAAARASFYRLPQPQALVGDGKVLDTTRGDETIAGKLFETYLGKITGPPPAPAAELDATASWKEGKLLAHVRVKLPQPLAEATNLRLIPLVVERCVFALGGNGVGLHYAVARGSMGSPEGLAVDPNAAQQEFDLALDFSSLNRRRPSTTTASTHPAGKGPPWMRPRDPDPRECSIALLVQDAKTHTVYAAVSIKPTLKTTAPETTAP